MSTIGIRIREERDKLGLSQTDFAKLAGFSRSAQAGYERGEKIPGAAYLEKLALVGCDVLYILTGTRITLQESYSKEEQKLVENYRAMDQAAKLNIQAVGDAFAQSKPNCKTGT